MQEMLRNGGFCQETKSGYSFPFNLPFIYILASSFAFSLLPSSRSLELLLQFQTLLDAQSDNILFKSLYF